MKFSWEVQKYVNTLKNSRNLSLPATFWFVGKDFSKSDKKILFV